MNPVEGYYYVVRDYSSHTAKNTLVKVLSRRMLFRRDAEQWISFCKSQEPKCKKDFYVIFKNEPWSDHHKQFTKKINYRGIEYWQK